MGNKKFSLTTYVIIVIALGALYFVGKTVTPPPAAPPDPVMCPPVPPGTPDPEEHADVPSHAERARPESRDAAGRVQRRPDWIRVNK